jgi:hypothetical protein
MISKTFANFGPEISDRNNERKKHMKTITKFIYSAFAVVILAIGALTASADPGDIFVSDVTSGVIHRLAPDGTEYPLFATGLVAPEGPGL